MRRALAFLTSVGPKPGERGGSPSPADLVWFPVVGAVLGTALGGLWWGADRVWPAPVAAGVVVAADLALTGLLHLDGLADSADGLLPPLPPERRLVVMASPEVGAFGVGTVAAVLILRVAALAAMPPSVLLLAGAWAASRTAMAVTAGTVPYVRPGGLASAFAGGRVGGVAAGGVGLALVLAGTGAGLRGVAAVVGVAAGAFLVVSLARRRIGGFTGDVLGAAGVVGETIGLLVAAARW